MTTRSVVMLATLLVALPASAQDRSEDATRTTAAACFEFLDQERLPACVLALQRQVLQLQAIVQDRGERLRRSRRAVRILSDKQQELPPSATVMIGSPSASPYCRTVDPAGGRQEGGAAARPLVFFGDMHVDRGIV